MPLSAASALVPLRVFLGVTFVYAGIQKLSDPGFLNPAAPTFIGTQLRSFAAGTPGGFLLRTFAIPDPKLAGIAVALVEIAVGLLVLVGLTTRAAAAVGLLLNLVLFLTNSWKTSPYFLGSDIIFVFAWLPFVLAGASGQPALDHQLGRIAGLRHAAARPTRRPGAGALPARDAVSTRRAVLIQALGVTGVATLVLGGLSALLKGSYRGAAHTLGAASTPQPATGAAAGAPPARQAQGQGAARPPRGAVKLGSSRQLPAGQAAQYTDPGDNQPDIVIRQQDGSLTAFSAVCTHQGCTVDYQGGQIVCPCHGGVYNARSGAVEGGPPPSALPARRIMEQGGLIYAIPA